MPEITFKPYIVTGQYIFFKGGWKDKENKIYRAGYTQTFPNRFSFIVSAGSTHDFKLEDKGLYPESTETFYELAWGMKGNAILQVRLPSTAYYNILEKSGFEPNDALTSNQYVGGYMEEDMPYDANPLIFREYVVKDHETIVYRLKAESFENEKILLRCVVNRVQLVGLDKREEEYVKRNTDELLARDMLRILYFWKLVRWEVE